MTTTEEAETTTRIGGEVLAAMLAALYAPAGCRVEMGWALV